MRSLQVRIALIIAASILAVMIVATVATAMMLFTGEAERMVGPVADRISGTSRDGPLVARIERRLQLRDRMADAPAPGVRRADLSAALADVLSREGLTGTVIVTDDPQFRSPVASYDFGGGKWGIFPFPRPLSPPPQFWLLLSSWLALVLAGVSAVALLMARRVTQPFVVLEQAVASIGADGVLPHVPATGSGEVRHMAAMLNRLSDRLRSSMDSRMRLVAAAGHDLRTPMTRMRLRAEFLPDDERAGWLADLDELELIADSAIRLVREEGAHDEQVVVDLDAVVRETAAELTSAQLPVVLGDVAPTRITAAPLALKRALRNLIINAATHGEGAEVRLRDDSQNAVLEIVDHGPGIPDAMLSQVFEPFFRAEPGRTRRVKGAGLGLAIAKDIIERFGGSISIANVPQGGLRQTVIFPKVLT